MSRSCISGGKQVIKYANTNDHSRVFFIIIILPKRDDDFSHAKLMHSPSFDKFYVIIACCEDIFSC